jgi:hypothetical protein
MKRGESDVTGHGTGSGKAAGEDGQEEREKPEE